MACLPDPVLSGIYTCQKADSYRPQVAPFDSRYTMEYLQIVPIGANGLATSYGEINRPINYPTHQPQKNNYATLSVNQGPNSLNYFQSDSYYGQQGATATNGQSNNFNGVQVVYSNEIGGNVAQYGNSNSGQTSSLNSQLGGAYGGQVIGPTNSYNQLGGQVYGTSINSLAQNAGQSNPASALNYGTPGPSYPKSQNYALSSGLSPPNVPVFGQGAGQYNNLATLFPNTFYNRQQAIVNGVSPNVVSPPNQAISSTAANNGQPSRTSDLIEPNEDLFPFIEETENGVEKGDPDEGISDNGGPDLDQSIPEKRNIQKPRSLMLQLQLDQLLNRDLNRRINQQQQHGK